MIYPRWHNWRTTALPYSLALTNTVNTGGSWNTSSGTIANQKTWASAGFRGFGPTMTFPGSSGMDSLGCGCGGGCDCGCGGGDGAAGLIWFALAGAALWFLCRRAGVEYYP